MGKGQWALPAGQAGHQVSPAMAFLGFGTHELTAGSSDPCHPPTSATGSRAGTWPLCGLRQGPMVQGTGWSPSPPALSQGVLEIPFPFL